MAERNETAQEARQKLVADWLFLSHAMRNCADSVNRYISFLAGSQNTPDFLQGIIQLPNLHMINPMDPNQLPRGATLSKKRGKKIGEDDEDEKPKLKRKREKKEKDPNAPKRPASAYIFFQNKVRQEMREQNPDMVYRDLVGKIAERWANLPAEEKKVYSDMASSEMEKWRADTAEYSRTGVAPVHPTEDEEDDDDDDDDESDTGIKVPQATVAAAATAATAVGADESSSDSDASEDVAEAVVPLSKAKSPKKPKTAAPAPAAVEAHSSKPKKKKAKAEKA